MTLRNLLCSQRTQADRKGEENCYFFLKVTHVEMISNIASIVKYVSYGCTVYGQTNIS